MVRALVSFCLVTFVAAAAAAGPSRVVVVQGIAEVTRSGESRELFAGDLIEEGDVIESGDDSYVRLMMKDGSILDLGANARLVIRKYSGKKPARKVSLKLWVGRLWARVIETVGGDDDYVLSGGNAVVGIRGTELVLEARADGSADVLLLHGRANLTSLVGDAPGIELRPMERGKVGAGGEITRGGLSEQEATELRKKGKPLPKLDRRGAEKRLNVVREQLQVEVTPTSEPVEMPASGDEEDEEKLDDLDQLEDDPSDPLLDLDPDTVGGGSVTRVRGDVEVLP
jgi:hypothetical protein